MIDRDGENLGVMYTREAIEQGQEVVGHGEALAMLRHEGLAPDQKEPVVWLTPD